MTNDAPAATEDQADPLAPDADAPFGYMIDPETQERRPKKRPGRQKVTPPAASPPPFSSPSADELKARQPIERTEDRSPDDAPRRPRGKRARTHKAGPKDVPPFRAGPIASGMNRLYAGVGKFVRAMDHDIGTAIIATTKKENDDDTTVGEAWEELARVNPRIRATLLRLIEGGAYQQLIWAHAPIALAVLMKDSIRRRLPFGKLLNSFLEPDPDGTPSDLSTALGGLNGADMEQMMAMAQGFAANVAMNMTRSAGPAGGNTVRGVVIPYEEQVPTSEPEPS